MSRYREEYGPQEDLDDGEVYEEVSASVARARRRRIRALVTILVLLLGLFYAFWWAYSYYKADRSGEDRPSTSATCRPAGPNEVTPAAVTLNVYNTTQRTGLAASVAKELGERGFVVAAVANDPLGKSVPGPAEVRFGPAGQAGADLVIGLLGEGVVTAADERADASVDIALGDGYAALLPAPSPTGLPLCPEPTAPVSPSPPPS